MKKMVVFIDGEEVIRGEVEAMSFEVGTRHRDIGPKMGVLVTDGTGDMKVKFGKLEKVAFPKVGS